MIYQENHRYIRKREPVVLDAEAIWHLWRVDIQRDSAVWMVHRDSIKIY